jgi:hypothetical protein
MDKDMDMNMNMDIDNIFHSFHVIGLFLSFF